MRTVSGADGRQEVVQRRVAQHGAVALVARRPLAAGVRVARRHVLGGEAALVAARHRQRQVLHRQRQLQQRTTCSYSTAQSCE